MHTYFIPLNNPYNVFAKVRGTNYIPVCYGSPSFLRYKDTSLVRTPFLSLTTTLKVCILIPQLSKKLTVFHPVGLYIRGVPFVITVIMINSVIPSYYKWKNHFFKMKGDVGMSGHEKERKQEDAYTQIQTHS